ncbi:hypothetical protein A3E15_02490 [Candidatus Woesebacteria bacterium RIFCSPHIGHO2_12_FULL_42_9]|uniref:HIT domain-containing protein n=3 Tax=Candidatus Woeseibacteriota TaxID=1752722 RepID=A0A1F8AWX4_9BACT|nr:MAG: hypothetical protein A2112_01015 [Candidatus Woesebacteria bacterium GWA1_42_12]OGM06531.1 MAG: hypothetical protein A2129_00450 [Candidatus Woesebacteria bacterium GWC1_42_13]OGM56253.1 MAG: hypothetical protein A3E15_02490 [Candidatus Woesebacteria bacterium RIFCSPHIGHO2_12_FULL_42_9]
MSDEPVKSSARLEGRYREIAQNLAKCIFCDLRDKYVVTRQDSWVLTVNIYPYIDGQLLVLPERHIESYQDLTSEDLLTSDRLIRKGIRLLKRGMGIQNYWIILREGKLAGKTVKHLHWNVMPYIEGLNTWHYQEIKVEPLKLAKKLRRALKK